MNSRQTGFGLGLGFLVLVALAGGLMAPPAGAQKARAGARYEYKVVPFRYSTIDGRGTDKTAADFEHLINDHARNGWEPVVNLLNQSNVNNTGGGVMTRDTVTFVAFRRPR